MKLGGQVHGVSGTLFGAATSLSADGSRLAVGASSADPTTRGGRDGSVYPNGGQAQVFEWNGTAWAPLGAPLVGRNNGDNFGSSVALSGDGSRLAVGAILAPYGTARGEVEVFEWNGTTWGQLGSYIQGAASDRLGSSVSLSFDGSRIAMGARHSSSVFTSAGEARVYEWNALAEAWEQLGPTLHAEANSELFGWRVLRAAYVAALATALRPAALSGCRHKPALCPCGAGPSR